jgi:hypothetical protein
MSNKCKIKIFCHEVQKKKTKKQKQEVKYNDK